MNDTFSMRHVINIQMLLFYSRLWMELADMWQDAVGIIQLIRVPRSHHVEKPNDHWDVQNVSLIDKLNCELSSMCVLYSPYF